MPTILIIGATGTVGRQLVSALVTTNIKIRVLLRNPDSDSSRLVARDLLRVSVIYLPLLLTAMMLDAKGRLLF